MKLGISSPYLAIGLAFIILALIIAICFTVNSKKTLNNLINVEEINHRAVFGPDDYLLKLYKRKKRLKMLIWFFSIALVVVTIVLFSIITISNSKFI